MDLNELLNEKSKLIVDSQVEDEEQGIIEGEIVQLVSFLLGEVEYGVDILLVHEIIRMPEITRLPNIPSFIKGVINLRGSVIPVVDVRERFGFASAEITEYTRIIVVEANDKLIGLLVDNVHQVVRLSINSIDPPSDLIEGISEEFIKGIGRLSDRLIVILNIESMLFEKEENRIENL